MKLILASASTRRRELLQNAGIDFEVRAANVNESITAGEAPQECAMRLAAEKARAVSRLWPDKHVLGADTIVVVDGAMLGKPRDQDDAKRMLRSLSGRSHEVITGVCLTGPNLPTGQDTRFEMTTVAMLQLSEDDITGYGSSREPMDKAGAYAIQGRASRWIHRIEGDYFNVVGLPVSLVYRMLRTHSVI